VGQIDSGGIFFLARVVSLPSLDAQATCEGQLVVEVDRLLVRQYPRPTIEMRYLPLVFGVVSLPGGPDEGDVTVVAGPQVYRDGERVRVLEGRTLLDRPVRRLHGLRFEVRLAENHTTVRPEWLTYAGMASDAAKALPGPTSDVISLGALVVHKLEHDDIMLTWAPDLQELIGYARQGGKLRYRLLTPALAPDGSPAAELELLVHLDRDPACP
jgi:hypothetical protein